jgi:polyhydroxyalkanoate synthesis regulator phasin
MTFPIPKEKKSKLQKSKLDIFEDIDKYDELNEKIRNLESEILKLKNEKK